MISGYNTVQGHLREKVISGQSNPFILLSKCRQLKNFSHINPFLTTKVKPQNQSLHEHIISTITPVKRAHQEY